MRGVPHYIFGASPIPYQNPLVSQFFLGEGGTPRRFHDFHLNVATVYVSSIRKVTAANMMGRYVPGARPNVRPNVRPNDRMYDRTYDRTTETYDRTTKSVRPNDQEDITYNITILSLSKPIFQYMIMFFNIRWGVVVSGRLVTWLKKGGTCCEQQNVEICFFLQILDKLIQIWTIALLSTYF